MTASTAAVAGFELTDAWRRRQGRLLDLAMQRKEAPFRILLDRPEVKLRAYGNADTSRPALVIVPAPIKRGYIWDLAPGISVVERCLDAGLAVYLLDWCQPGPEGRNAGLAAYADRLILDCLDAIGGSAVLAGHSLGGTFAAIFASLHPHRVRGLVLLEAPLGFGGDGGPIVELVRKMPRVVARCGGLGRIPGSMLDVLSCAASPEEFLLRRSRDTLASLADPHAMRTRILVERWALDEFPMPAALFEEVVDRLYREDRFLRGTLSIGGTQAAPERLIAPVLGAADPDSAVAPPTSMQPFFEMARGRGTRLLLYDGDIGTGLRHVGILVGRNAHGTLWPRILAWIRARGA